MRPLSIELYEMKSLRLFAVRTESQMLALQMSISQWQRLRTLISQMSCIKMKILTNREASSVKHLAFSSDSNRQYYGALCALCCDQSFVFMRVWRMRWFWCLYIIPFTFSHSSWSLFLQTTVNKGGGSFSGIDLLKKKKLDSFHLGWTKSNVKPKIFHYRTHLQEIMFHSRE